MISPDRTEARSRQRAGEEDSALTQHGGQLRLWK